MRKVEIVEIENSYLNFLTPAIIVVVGYFLFNLIAWPLIFVNWLIKQSDLVTLSELVNLLTSILACILVCIIIFFVVIPKLKIKDIDYEGTNSNYMLITILLFFLANTFRILFTIMLETLNLELEINPSSYYFPKDPILLALELSNVFVSSVLFAVLIYCRTIIPLLEDRGLSPLHAVILASIGYGFIDIPLYIIAMIYPEYYNLTFVGIIHNLFLTIMFCICAGIIYILSRNILFSILFGALYEFFKLIDPLGSYFENQVLLVTNDLLMFISFLGSLATIFIFISWKLIDKTPQQKLYTFLKKKSVPNIRRGMLGFFIITIGLLLLQTLTVLFTRILTNFPQNIPLYIALITPFYLIVFTIPFWLTITTEYAQDM